jgi:hypothetical protein
MAITTNYQSLKEKFKPEYWNSFEDFEEYYLRRLAEQLPDTNYYTNKDGVEITIKPINHHPELKEYEVWCEGYRATGEHGTATLLGKAKARNFAQACHIVMCKNHLAWIEQENQPNYNQHVVPGRWDYDPSQLRYWNCELFWSEGLAEKTFG